MSDTSNMPVRPDASGTIKTPGMRSHHPPAVQTESSSVAAMEFEMEQSASVVPLRRLVIAGLTTIAVAFGGFLGWAFSADISSAAVAMGSVIVDSKRKTVSHFEGGILSRLLIQEGDVVRVGQPLIELDDTRARSDLQSLQSRRIGLIAKLARLRTEQAGATEITYPGDFGQRDDMAVQDAIQAEQVFFEKRREAQRDRIQVQEKTIEEYSERAMWLQVQIEATDRQIELTQQQRDSIASLVDKGFAQRSRLIELDTTLSQLASARGELAGDKAQAEKAMAGAKLALTGIESQLQSEIAGEITTARVELADTEEQMVKAKDILQRLEIRSPQAGIVTNIRMRTPGSAISPGEPLLDIVPENEPLVVEMNVSPRDVDSIRVGSKTQIRLTAYNKRSHLPLNGEIIYVAADQSVDEQSNVAYFVARAKVDPASLSANPDIRLSPGMPAEVLIVHEPRKAIEYLTAPIRTSMNRALREE